MLVVGVGIGPTAGREGAAGVQDPGQMPEHGSRIVAGLVPVIAWPGQWLQDELQVPASVGRHRLRAGERGQVQPQGPVPGGPRSAEVKPGPRAGGGPAAPLRRERGGGHRTMGDGPAVGVVMVTHQVDRGLREAAAARSRTSSGSMAPTRA